MNEHSDERGLPDDTLSADARAFLARADRPFQVPNPEVKQRVRAAVGVALIAAPLGAAPAALHELGGAAKLAARWSLGAKLGAVAVAATLAGTGGWLLTSSSETSTVRSTHSVSAPAVSADERSNSTSKVVPAIEPAARAPVVAHAPLAVAEGLPPTAPQQVVAEGATGAAGVNEVVADTVGVVDRSELSLLMAASRALDAALTPGATTPVDAREVERSLALLAQHRERFPGSALEQERRGLGLVARCLLDGGHDARLGREASAFLRHFPGAVLTTRIRRACGL